MKILLFLIVLPLLLGCGGPREMEPGEAPKDLHGAEPSADEGQWRRTGADGGQALVFLTGAAQPAATIRCDAAMETLLIERTARTSRGVETMTVRAGGRTRRLPVTWNGARPPVASAMVKLEDRLTDSLSRVSGSFEIALRGEPTLALPADRRIGTLIEQCRQGRRG